MTKKRTFGDLKPGSYFWRATPGSVNAGCGSMG